MAKGSGMIRPDMATMLAYVATDLAVDSTLLHQCLQQAVAAFVQFDYRGRGYIDQRCLRTGSHRSIRVCTGERSGK